MKAARLLLILCIALIAASSSGCLSKRWSYDFTSDSATMEDWYRTFSGTFNLDADGLCIDEGTITTPVYFTGDTSVKITLDIDVKDSSIDFLEFGICDNMIWSGPNMTFVTILFLGNDADENWSLVDFGWTGDETYAHAEPVDKVNHDGINTFEFSRIGSKVTFSVNGSVIGEIDLVYFDIHTDGFFPTISVKGALGTSTIRRVDVRYSGDVSEEWPV